MTALPKTIAIDGPAGSGKSSVSFALAKELGYLFVDTGAFYRAVTLAAIRANAAQADDATLIEIARTAQLDITNDQRDDNQDDRHYTIFLNGQDVTEEVRSHEVETYVSRVSAIAGVRDVLNAKYRALATRGPVLMAGRDIGTIVLPEAELKIYLDASIAERARRRHNQRRSAGEKADYDAIIMALIARDALDSQRAVAPLRRAPDAAYFNTDNLDIETVVERVKELIRDWHAT